MDETNGDRSCMQRRSTKGCEIVCTSFTNTEKEIPKLFPLLRPIECRSTKETKLRREIDSIISNDIICESEI